MIIFTEVVDAAVVVDFTFTTFTTVGHFWRKKTNRQQEATSLTLWQSEDRLLIEMAHLVCDEDSDVEPLNSPDIQLLVFIDSDSNSESGEYEDTPDVLLEQEAPFSIEEMDAATLPPDCEAILLIYSDEALNSATTAVRFRGESAAFRECVLSGFVLFQLLHFSQQLSSCLENLTKMFASFNLITLDETDPCGMSHFCCGEVHLESWYRVLLFRYCSPTPFNARDEACTLYKKMRWNVELLESSCPSQGEAETKYYFLCCKSNTETSDTSAQMSGSWSIGKGIQISPDPRNEDIQSWILCTHATMKFQALLNLGTEEPSTTQATDCLMEILQNPWMESSLPLDCNPLEPSVEFQ
ncbi:CS067 protein, partial [Polypterus senegalus]|nr:CS067 protein [Polypterus senegalus]